MYRNRQKGLFSRNELRHWFIAKIETHFIGTEMPTVAFVPLDANENSMTVLAVARNRAPDLFSSTCTVLARVVLTPNRFQIVARSEPLLRRRLSNTEWQAMLTKACASLGADPSLLRALSTNVKNFAVSCE